jgi:2-polyprenyl-3-methyl-5-hydroxy-6-metoxy-1,4-benzoquinol methylase
VECSEYALQQVRVRRLLIDRVDSWLYDEIAPYLGQRVLEMGCGLGNLARHLVDRELYVGVDLSEESVAHVAQAYRSYPNVHACVADVTQPGFARFARFNFDTIVSLNLLEHIEDDVSVLRCAAKILRPAGTLVLVVPAHAALYGTMDRSIGHHRRYTRQTMAAMLSRLGLTCVLQKYVNALGALGWFVNGRILRQRVPPSGQLRSFNRLVPLLRRLERSVDVPFGVSLLTVARKGVRTG